MEARYRGIKARIRVDSESGTLHSVLATQANQFDGTQMTEALHG